VIGDALIYPFTLDVTTPILTAASIVSSRTIPTAVAVATNTIIGTTTPIAVDSLTAFTIIPALAVAKANAQVIRCMCNTLPTGTEEPGWSVVVHKEAPCSIKEAALFSVNVPTWRGLSTWNSFRHTKDAPVQTLRHNYAMPCGVGGG